MKFGSVGPYPDDDAIVSENDAPLRSSQFGDQITALTVHNTGTLAARYIDAVALQQNGTTIATATSASGGTWVLDPGPDAGTFGPSATNVSVTATLAADAPVGETVDFAVSSVTDRGTAGTFDGGDRGLFFADERPVGGIDSGHSYTVGDPSAIGASAIAFADPGRDGAAVELAFTDQVDPATTEPGDFAVETTSGERVNVTGVADDDGDRRVVLALNASVPPSTIGAVALETGGVATASGAAVPAQTIGVEPTSVTLTEADETPRMVFRGDRIALLANEGGNDDEAVRVDQDLDGNGVATDLRRLGSTGNGSRIAVVDTGSSNASGYTATFQSEDGTAGESVTVPVRNLTLGLAANRTNTTDVEGPIAATVAVPDGRRPLRATLIDVDDGSVLASKLVTIGGDGEGTVSFPPRVANVSIAVTDLGTGVSNRTANITVREGHPGATFVSDRIVEERGDVATIDVRLVDTTNATITIGSEAVNYQESVPVVDHDGDGLVRLTVNTHRAGRGGAGRGIGLEPGGDHAKPVDELGGIRRRAPNGRGLTHPLEVADYELNATVNGTTTDLAILRVRDRATEGARTLVAPAGVDLATETDLANWTTERGTVALGDQAVVAVDASGLSGFVTETTDLRRGSPAAARTGAYLEVQGRDPPPNTPARRLNVSHASHVLDAHDDTLYVVIPTDGDPYAIEDGDSFDASFVLNETSPYVAGRSTPTVIERESVTTALAFASPEGRFDDVSENDTLDLPASATATVGGETNVAPGTNVTIVVDSDDENVTFRRTTTETVDDDGTFDGSVDLADYPEGTDYTVVATANGDDLTPVLTGSVVEAAVAVNASQNVTALGGGGGVASGDGGTAVTAEPTTTEQRDETRTAAPGRDDTIEERVRTIVEQVPEFIRTRATTIVLGFGALAVLVVFRGIVSLTR